MLVEYKYNPFMNIDKQLYTWVEFDQDVREIAQRIKESGKKFDGIWGPPRGGLVPAVVLSNALNLPILLWPTANTLVVDDIADTGATLNSFRRNFIATIFYHQQSKVVPDIWIKEKTIAWIVFPWETTILPPH